MRPAEVLAMLVPIIVALIVGRFAYSQAKMVAERNAKAQAEAATVEAKKEADKIAGQAKIEAERIAGENRAENRRGWEALNRDLVHEIDRLRRDRREDQLAAREAIQGIAAELNGVRDQCMSQGEHLRALEAWARAVVDILSREPVMSVLEAHQLHVPTMPQINWRP